LHEPASGGREFLSGCIIQSASRAKSVVSELPEPTRSARIPWGQPTEGTIMHLSNESVIVILVVGIVAGWLAGKIVDGGGFGLIGDLVVGIIGAFIGIWLLPRLNIHLVSGSV